MTYAAYKTALDARPGNEIEADALLRSALRLEKAQDPEALIRAVGTNARLWTAILSDIGDNPGRLPRELEDNLIKLGYYVLANIGRAMAGEAAVIATLVSVNRNLAAGLRGSPG